MDNAQERVIGQPFSMAVQKTGLILHGHAPGMANGFDVALQQSKRRLPMGHRCLLPLPITMAVALAKSTSARFMPSIFQP